MVVDKKLFQFLDEFFAEVIDVFYMGVAVVHLLYGHDAIIAFRLTLFSLFALNDANCPAF